MVAARFELHQLLHGDNNVAKLKSSNDKLRNQVNNLENAMRNLKKRLEGQLNHMKLLNNRKKCGCGGLKGPDLQLPEVQDEE